LKEKRKERRNSPMESVAEIRFEDKDLFERWGGRVKEDFWG
jgi:hypothetical protein